jgi:taurine dioxygenase
MRSADTSHGLPDGDRHADNRQQIIQEQQGANNLEIRPLRPEFGAEIIGVDLSQEFDPELFGRIESTYDERGVLLFRNQHMTDEQLVRFSRRFGELEVHSLREYVKHDHPEIFILSNIVENGRPIGNKDAGGTWHTDLSYMKAPSRGSILYAIEVPHDDDGEPLGGTCFTSSAHAHDRLPEALRVRLASLKAVHGLWERHEKDRIAAGQPELIIRDPARRAAVPDVIHPIVRTHPKTGRKCLYVNEGQTTRIVGLPDDESRALLDRLFEHSTDPAFVYTHRWQARDVVMWDNCSMLHRAVIDYKLPRRRLMNRTTIRGTEVF